MDEVTTDAHWILARKCLMRCYGELLGCCVDLQNDGTDLASQEHIDGDFLLDRYDGWPKFSKPGGGSTDDHTPEAVRVASHLIYQPMLIAGKLRLIQT